MVTISQALEHLGEALLTPAFTTNPACPPFVTGSTLVQEEGNDCDIVVLFDGAAHKAYPHAINELTACGGDYETGGDGWGAYRKGEVNLLLCHSQEAYSCWLRATRALYSLAQVTDCMKDKKVRVALFRALIDEELSL